MRRTSKIFLTMALVSSVATIALTPVNADAQRSRTVKLPSVEIHLEVLGSLRSSIANRYDSQQYIAQPSIAQPVIAPSIGSFASEVARQVPTANHQVVAQPLPNASRARVASVTQPRGEVIMQPLPGKNTRIATVEPTEEHIIMQEMPLSSQEFPIASGLQEVPVVSPVISPVEIAEKTSEPKSIFDKVAGFFTGEEKEAVSHPLLKESLPVVTAQAPSVNAVVPATDEEESFFSAMQNEIVAPSAAAAVAAVPSVASVASVPTVKPEAVVPSREMIAKILAPEIQQQAAVAPSVAPRFEQPVIQAQPTELAPPAAVKEVEVAMPDVQAPQVRDLSVPKNFPIAQKVPTLTAPAVLAEPLVSPLPVEVVKAPVVEAPSNVEFKPFEPVATPSSDEDGFPRLSEVETASSIGALVEDIPKDAQEWLNEGAEVLPVEPLPAMPMESTVVTQKLEMPPSILQEPAKLKPVAPLVEPIVQPVLEPTKKIVEAPKLAPIPEPEIVKTPIIKTPEPVVAKKQVIASPKLEVVKEIATPIAEPELVLSSAEESFLTNASNPEKVPLPEITDETPAMELALEELEKSIEPEAAAAEDLDFALLEPQPVTPPVVAAAPVAKDDEGIFPGITKTFKGLLDDEEKPAAIAAPVAPAEPIFSKEQVAENILPPELPVADEAKDVALPGMELLNSDVEGRFDAETLAAPEFELAEIPDVEPVKLAEPEFEVAALPAEPKITAPVKSADIGGINLSIDYGKDDTDIPDQHKSRLTSIAKEASSAGKRIIISSYASGEEDESKAANMISLSRGLSLRAYFIDNGVAMDRIIVQAKGIENSGGAADRADVSID